MLLYITLSGLNLRKALKGPYTLSKGAALRKKQKKATLSSRFYIYYLFRCWRPLQYHVIAGEDTCNGSLSYVVKLLELHPKFLGLHH